MATPAPASPHPVVRHLCRAPRVAGAAFGAALGALLLGSAPNAASAQATPARPAANRATRPARPGAWVSLLNGKDLSQWRGFKRQDVPTGWQVQGNTIAFVPGGDSVAHGDLITRDAYGDFELEYEWKIAPAGNSGVIYRATEDAPTAWQTGPEMQVLDDARHADGRLPTHRAGALYDLIAPPPGVARPVGEFNRARIVMRGSHVQQYLNGRLTADLDFASPRGQQLVAASKFHVYPGYAKARTGHIALQDHGNAVTYQNIRIRRLDAGQ